ncbi:hypothetical protein KAOT1_11101 [Kordia algicida OT-1]|uniref:Uncharacterized protein n=1 Tax=Kordia algicida OT-1 TaxID=391587 RepID=A9E350_9FLAO|nr:hypothetical protein KAOT1_11101 [Kordia algicida OT-1]
MSHVAYFQLNIDYIIETYCINKDKPQLECNGKCHLATQLAEIDPGAKDSNTSNSINTKEIFTLVFLVKNTVNLPEKSQNFSPKKLINSYQKNYSFLGISSCFKPPQEYLV